MEKDFSKFVQGFSITGAGVLYSAVMFYGAALLTVNLLGPTLYGLYSLSYMIPNVVIYFLLFGLDVTAARYIAHHLGKNNDEKALQCAQTIFVVRILIAFFSMVVFFGLSDFLAILLKEDIVLGLQLFSVYICVYLIAKYLLAVLQGYFLMKERTITEAVLNTMILLFLLPFFYGGFGYVAPILALICAFVSAIIMSVYYLEKEKIPAFKIRFEGFSALKEYLKFSFHVYVSDSFHIAYVWVGTIVITLYSLPVKIVGYYRAMFSITNTVLLISYGLTIVLYPMLSELNARKEYKRLAFSLHKVLTFTLALSIPAALGMLFVSRPLVAVLFPEYVPAVPLLRMFSLRMLFFPLWSVLATALLTLDRARQQAFIAVFMCGFSFLLSAVLGLYAVEGIALASTIGLAVAVVVQYAVLKRKIPSLSLGPVPKFCGSAAVMCGVVWLILQTGLPDAAKVGLSFVGGILVYTVLVLKIGAVSRADLALIRSGLSAFGKFSTVFKLVLDIAEKIQKS